MLRSFLQREDDLPRRDPNPPTTCPTPPFLRGGLDMSWEDLDLFVLTRAELGPLLGAGVGAQELLRGAAAEGLFFFIMPEDGALSKDFLMVAEAKADMIADCAGMNYLQCCDLARGRGLRSSSTPCTRTRIGILDSTRQFRDNVIIKPLLTSLYNFFAWIDAGTTLAFMSHSDHCVNKVSPILVSPQRTYPPPQYCSKQRQFGTTNRA